MDRFKPKKRTCIHCHGTKELTDAFGEKFDCPHCYLTFQWNECVKSFEAFLPGVDELETIIVENMTKTPREQAEILAERIGR